MNRLHAASLLATLAALLTASTGARADEPEDPPAPPAHVAVRTDATDVTIGYITGRAAFGASNGVTAMGVSWKDICIAPCEFKLPSGLHELVATGPGYVGGHLKVELRPGDNHFVVKPGSAIMRWSGWALAGIGLSALSAGIVFAAMGTTTFDSKGNMKTVTPGWAVPVAVAGGLGAVGGITLVVLSSTSIERESGGSSGTGRSTYVGAGYTGRF